MINTADKADLLAFARTLADRADEVAMRHYREGVSGERKADGTFVTAADREVEALLRAEIAATYPDHAVLGEEDGLAGSVDALARWIVDPIDGTHGFLRGLPLWGTLIACERDGRIEVGVASAPALGARWWAGRGLGAYRIDAGLGEEALPIRVSEVDDLADAQVLFGSFALTEQAWGGRAIEVLRSSWRQRGFGDFWGHCLVAQGAAEVMLDPEVSAWDIAALLVIVEEAGGRMTNLEGEATILGGEAITSNGRLHEELLARLVGDPGSHS